MDNREALIKRIDDYIADGSEVFDGEMYRPLSFNILTDVRDFLTRTEATTGEMDQLARVVEAAKVAEVCAVLATRYDAEGDAQISNHKSPSRYRVAAAYEQHLVAIRRAVECIAALAQPVRVDDHALATSEVVDGETANGDQQDEGGVIQADSDAAADLIESYWTGTGEGYGNMQRLAQAYRDGYTQGVWAKAFAAHRRAFSRERGGA